jgi:hypothetical protein
MKMKKKKKRKKKKEKRSQLCGGSQEVCEKTKWRSKKFDGLCRTNKCTEIILLIFLRFQFKYFKLDVHNDSKLKNLSSIAELLCTNSVQIA